jgi:hypothetical protein
MAIAEFTPEELETEEWREISGYSGNYLVSNLGRVFSKARVVCRGIMKGEVNKAGYHRVVLTKDGPIKKISVHRLVAQAFLPTDPGRTQVNHKDGNKLNNRLTNLEYVSPCENQRHAVKVGLIKSGAAHYSKTKPHLVRTGSEYWEQRNIAEYKRGSRRKDSKLDEAKVSEMRALHATGVGYRELSRRYEVDHQTVRKAVARLTWKHVS